MKYLLYTLLCTFFSTVATSQIGFEIDSRKINTGLLFAKSKNSKEFSKYIDQDLYCKKNHDWVSNYFYLSRLNSKNLIDMPAPNSIFSVTKKKAIDTRKVQVVLFDYNYNLIADQAFTDGKLCVHDKTIVDQTTQMETPLVRENIMLAGFVFPTAKDIPDVLTLSLSKENIYSNRKVELNSLTIEVDGKVVADWNTGRGDITLKTSSILNKELLITVIKGDVTKELCYTLTEDMFTAGIGSTTNVSYMYTLKFDLDGDGITDENDNCINTYNPFQYDQDGDGIGDSCDEDRDGDGFLNDEDNCPNVHNTHQNDSNNNGIGDACEMSGDVDSDCVDDEDDNCPTVFNPFQSDIDGDGLGDACDNDIDGDGILNETDLCPEINDENNKDTDGDGIGDICDEDIDGDGVINSEDNCVYTPNKAQEDFDFDGIGTLCDNHESSYGCAIGPDQIVPITATRPFTVGFGGAPGDVNISTTSPEEINDYLNNMSPSSASGLVGGTFGTAEIGIYRNPTNDGTLKPVIISDGIDLDNSRGIHQIKQLFGGNNSLRTLWDNGYDLVIVNYDYGADFIEKNAYAFQEVLRYLIDVEKVEEIPAVFGPSMGGLVVSYALLDWENTFEESHKVQVFFGGDVPWRGANVSPAVGGLLSQFTLFGGEVYKLYSSLNSPAARQMTLNEFSTNHAKINSTIHYFPGHHYLFDQFYPKLNEMGLLPQATSKNLAIAAGALTNAGSSFSPAGSDVIVGSVVSDNGFQADLRIRSVKDNTMTVNSSGLLSIIDELFTKPVCNEYDSEKGSTFGLIDKVGNISEVFSGLGIVINVRVDIEDELAFVPTFSAMAVDTEDPTLEFTPTGSDGFGGTSFAESPFDFVFVDDINSEHVGFTNNAVNGTGTDFNWAVSQLNGTSGTLTEACETLVKDIIPFNSITVGNASVIDVPYSDDMYIYPFNKYNLRITKTSGDLNVEAYARHCAPAFDTPSCEVFGTATYEFCINLILDDCSTSLCETLTITVEEDPDCNYEITQDEYDNSETRSIVESTELRVYPNPTTGYVSLTNSSGGYVNIYDLQGKLVFQKSVVENAKLDLELANSLYLLEFVSDIDGNKQIKKLIIQ